MQRATPLTDERAVVHILDNGMTVMLEALPYLRSAAVGIWVKTGSVNERADQAGISHFLEHLFFKGTTTRTAHQLMEAVERLGGHVNAFTGRDYTCVYVRVLDTHVATGIEILADIIRNSQFSDLDKERHVVLEEIASVEDVPEEHAHDLFVQRLWPDHPLGRPVTGACDTVSRLHLEDIRAYYSTWYRPSNMFVSVAGHFEEEVVLDQITREFGAIPSGPLLSPSDPPHSAAGIDFVERDIAQNHLCFGFPGLAATDPRRYAYDMLTSTLGGGSTSRLFERIRENEGLAYAIYSFHSSYATAGLTGVYAAVAPQNLERVIELACEEVRRLREQPVGQDELELNREQLKGNMLMALESTSNRMSRMARSMLYYDRIITIEETVNAIDAVTAGDIQEMAQELFNPNRCAAVILGPANNVRPARMPL